jgi:hypothetical protein
MSNKQDGNQAGRSKGSNKELPTKSLKQKSSNRTGRMRNNSARESRREI